MTPLEVRNFAWKVYRYCDEHGLNDFTFQDYRRFCEKLNVPIF
jgi:hypothetical protein